MSGNQERLTPAQLRKLTRPRNKYRARGTHTADGWFDSQRELTRWSHLQLLERAGTITDLRRQVPFPIEINGVLICRYVADFTYRENGALVVEDAKGVKTVVFKLKALLMRAVHGIEIRIT